MKLLDSPFPGHTPAPSAPAAGAGNRKTPSAFRENRFRFSGKPFPLFRKSAALLASALALALLTVAPQDAAGQSYSYRTQYSERTIQHKPAKWHAMREGLNNLDDTFSEGEEYMTTVFGHRMQAAHEYIDTIYMHVDS